MASSSSSFMATDQPCFSYDVFLSFRGEDTRENFTDHLYTALKQAGIRTFRDDSMDRGRQLSSELTKAIQESAISVIVFSESYATSRWCLDEVMMIIEKHETSSSKHEVVPVFYKVDPSDVRHQRGSFKEAFDWYDDEIEAETDLERKREMVEKVGAWRDSLNKAATLTGLVYKDGYESKFIVKIVNDVKKKVDYKVLFVEDKLVGIESRVAKIELWLQEPSPDASILLIDGMGGIGKTTLAKCIFNSNLRKYEGSCFLADVNETSTQSRGLIRLQRQLLSAVLKSKKKEDISSVGEGTRKIIDAICNKKVLLILDDVTTSRQLEALLGTQRFCPGSKVIITTRHKDLLNAFRFPHKVEVLSIGTLSSGEDTKLFSLYAFDQHQPIEPYIVQSNVVVQHCMGLPLALKVLGSSLRGSTEDVWEDTMRKLEAIPNPEIQEVLQISYETLADDKDKDFFLHVACFFVGEEKEYIVKLLAECGLYPLVGFKNLMGRCLLYVDQYGRVMMHQLIKEMGREVVRQESPKDPGKRSRLWHHEDCFNVLQDHTGTKKVEGFTLDMQKMKEAKSTTALGMYNPRKRTYEEYIGERVHENYVNFKIGALEKMKNLMLLQLNYVTFSGKYKKLPKKLRLLSWHGFSLNAIPVDICLEKLVVLDMSYSKLKCVWDDFKFIGSLKILNLSYSAELIETPDFGGLPGLESLILKGCISLLKVNESIEYLKELLLLDLTDCRSLRDFPRFPGSLISLNMSGCLNLGRVQSLDSVISFSLLKKANFSYCNLFDNSFPNDMNSLVSLVYLNIDGNNVTSLPKCIQTLPRIQTLSMESCSKLQTILGLPEFIKDLYISDNVSLEKVQPAQNSRITVYRPNCPKLCYMEGRYMVQSIDKVERKIIRYLGLELDVGEGMELDLEVLHEFGIFSTCVSEKQIPSSFMYRERGPQISFEVPWHDDSSRISAFNLCMVLFEYSINRYMFVGLVIKVYNKTKDLLWTYAKGRQEIPNNAEKFAILSLWRCGNLLDAGDEIVIDAVNVGGEVEECCINLIYEDDEQIHGERKKTHRDNALDQISWTDRMDKDISDYAYSGNEHQFGTDYHIIP